MNTCFAIIYLLAKFIRESYLRSYITRDRLYIQIGVEYINRNYLFIYTLEYRYIPVDMYHQSLMTYYQIPPLNFISVLSCLPCYNNPWVF